MYSGFLNDAEVEPAIIMLLLLLAFADEVDGRGME